MTDDDLLKLLKSLNYKKLKELIDKRVPFNVNLLTEEGNSLLFWAVSNPGYVATREARQEFIRYLLNHKDFIHINKLSKRSLHSAFLIAVRNDDAYSNIVALFFNCQKEVDLIYSNGYLVANLLLHEIHYTEKQINEKRWLPIEEWIKAKKNLYEKLIIIASHHAEVKKDDVLLLKLNGICSQRKELQLRHLEFKKILKKEHLTPLEFFRWELGKKLERSDSGTRLEYLSDESMMVRSPSRCIFFPPSPVWIKAQFNFGLGELRSVFLFFKRF